MIWDVWSEGYAATGEHGTAQFMGRAWAETFVRACELVHIKCGGDKMVGQFDPGDDKRPPSFWACRLYDNEADARASYG